MRTASLGAWVPARRSVSPELPGVVRGVAAVIEEPFLSWCGVARPALASVAPLEFDDIVAVGLRPDVGQAVVDVAAVADGHPCYLIVLELDIVVVGGVVGVGEADEAARLNDEEIRGPVDVFGERRAGCER